MPPTTESMRTRGARRSFLLFIATLAGSLGLVLLSPPVGRTQPATQRGTEGSSEPERVRDWRKEKIFVSGPVHVAPMEGAKTPDYLMLDRPWQKGNVCGPNALFLLLRVLDRSVSYQEVTDALPVGPDGASLDDIRKAAERFGIRAEVRHLNPDDLATAPMPIIVHMLKPGSNAASDRITGHFTILTRAIPTGDLLGIDTSNGLVMTFSSRALARNFSGYVLVPDTAKSWAQSREGVFYIALLGGVVLLNAALLVKLVRHKPSPVAVAATSAPPGMKD